MTGPKQVICVDASEEIQWIAGILGDFAGQDARTAILQLKDAVDELIAADLEFDSAFIQCRETINGDKEVVAASMHRWLAAQERRKIALARVKGESA